MKKLNSHQIAKLKTIKDNVTRLNKAIDFMVVEAYNTVGIDPNSDDTYQCDWIFDMLMNDRDFEVCLKNAGFVL